MAIWDRGALPETDWHGVLTWLKQNLFIYKKQDINQSTFSLIKGEDCLVKPLVPFFWVSGQRSFCAGLFPWHLPFNTLPAEERKRYVTWMRHRMNSIKRFMALSRNATSIQSNLSISFVRVLVELWRQVVLREWIYFSKAVQRVWEKEKESKPPQK